MIDGFESGSNRASHQSGETTPKKDPMQPALSLFDELFAKEEQSSWSRRQKPRKLEKLPAFNWKGGSAITNLDHKGGYESSSGTSQTDSLVDLRKGSAFHDAREESTSSKPAVLLVSSLSKNLEESDFMRLSPKAEHIEGWSNGLIKGTLRNCLTAYLHR